MEKREFLDSLPRSEDCHNCGAVVRAADWQVTQRGPGEWMAVGLAYCASCSRLHIAAAGSTKWAHEDAQKLRMKLMQSLPRQ